LARAECQTKSPQTSGSPLHTRSQKGRAWPREWSRTTITSQNQTIRCSFNYRITRVRHLSAWKRARARGWAASAGDRPTNPTRIPTSLVVRTSHPCNSNLRSNEMWPPHKAYQPLEPIRRKTRQRSPSRGRTCCRHQTQSNSRSPPRRARLGLKSAKIWVPPITERVLGG
jgi:hypothetical protein